MSKKWQGVRVRAEEADKTVMAAKARAAGYATDRGPGMSSMLRDMGLYATDTEIARIKARREKQEVKTG